MWRGRRRRGLKGRMPKPVRLQKTPAVRGYMPFPMGNATPVYLDPAELEALRLVDLQGMSQDEAGEKMGVSRGTIWRLLQTGRKKVVQALTEGRQILLNP